MEERKKLYIKVYITMSRVCIRSIKYSALHIRSKVRHENNIRCRDISILLEKTAALPEIFVNILCCQAVFQYCSKVGLR